jgi:hypothetical protein
MAFDIGRGDVIIVRIDRSTNDPRIAGESSVVVGERRNEAQKGEPDVARHEAEFLVGPEGRLDASDAWHG